MLLAQIKAALGSLDRVERIVKLGVFVNSAPSFTDQPKVANGASELMQEVFGEAGPPRPQRGRSRGPPARRRGRSRRDRRGEGLVHLGAAYPLKGMADRESEVLARIASGRCRARRRRLGRAGRRRSVPQPRLPLGARGFGQRRAGHRLDAGADPDRGRRVASRRRRARLSQEPQPGRICVRPRLGRGVGARRRAILSQAPGRGAVHAGAGTAAARTPAAAAARRDRSGDRAERPVFGAHHLHRRGRRGRMRAARLADPPRHPISLVQPRLCELRRFPRRAQSAASARRSARNARRRARASSSAQLARRRDRPADWDAMWAFYQDTGSRKWGRPYLTRDFFDLRRRADGRPAAAVPRLPRRPADRRRAQLHRRRHALRPLLGHASTKCRSSISSFAITRRSNGRSSTAWRRSRPARRASTSSRAAMSR